MSLKGRFDYYTRILNYLVEKISPPYPTDIINVRINQKLFDYAVTNEGIKYRFHPMLNTVNQVFDDYVMDDIKKNDIVIDIGGCIGGFSLPASRLSSHVFSVEPIFVDDIKDQIALNGIENVTVIPDALGDGEVQEVCWMTERVRIKTRSLTDLIKQAGRCDFLKCDCEGAEWNISAVELKKIRRIEMEIHDVGKPFSEMLKRFESAGFSYYTHYPSDTSDDVIILHAINSESPHDDLAGFIIKDRHKRRLGKENMLEITNS